LEAAYSGSARHDYELREPMAIIERDRATFHQPLPIRPTAESIRIDRPAVFERAGPFEVRLASGSKDVRAAQRLRYSVFHEEGGAIAERDGAATRRDICPFDEICDHLVVIDTEAQTASGRRKPRLVGTYRLLRREVAEHYRGFYSQAEFDLKPLLDRHPTMRFLELGRSCVHADYRSKRVIELLWRGLWLYAKHYRIDALIGCASLPGTDLEALRLPLSFLLRHAQAEPSLQIGAWPQRAASFVPLETSEVDVRRGLIALPPLIKAYLRTGARFGRDVVIDHQFCTTDVFTIMPMADIEERYIAHYGEPSCVSGVPVA
jgi:putative hemolysin